MNKILIIGSAVDGPIGQVFQGRSLLEYYQMFGGRVTEQFTVTPTQTTVDLTYSPYGTVSDLIDGRGSNKLYQPTPSGTTLSFGPLGGGDDLDVTLYYQPYLGYSDLLTAVKYFFNETGEFPYVMRAGGTKATCEIDDYIFEARYAGELYNKLQIVVSGSTVTISGDPRFGELNYTTTNIDEHLINDYNNLLSPLRIKSFGSSLSPGTYNFSGGDSGVFSDDDLGAVLNTADIPPVYLVTCLKEYTNESSLSVINNTRFDKKRIYMFGPVAGDGTWQENTLTAAGWYTSDYILSVQDTINIYDVGTVERYGVEALGISLINNLTTQITNLPLPVKSLNTSYTESDLNTLKDRGFIGFTRKIRAGISPYVGVNTSKTDLYLKQLECYVHGEVEDYAVRYIGQTLRPGRYQKIAEDIKDILLQYPFDIRSVEAYVINDTRNQTYPIGGDVARIIGSYLVIEITALMYDEILNFTIEVQTR